MANFKSWQLCETGDFSFSLSSQFNVTLWQIPRIILTHPSTSDEDVEPLTQGPDDGDFDSDFSDSDSHIYSDCLNSAFYPLWKIEKYTDSRFFISFHAFRLVCHLILNDPNILFQFLIAIFFHVPEIIIFNKEHVVISMTGNGFIHRHKHAK